VKKILRTIGLAATNLSLGLGYMWHSRVAPLLPHLKSNTSKVSITSLGLFERTKTWSRC